EMRIATAIAQIFSSPENSADFLKPASLERNQDARDLIWIGAPAVPSIAKALDEFSLPEVTAAAFLLGCIGNAEAAAAIREALQRPDPLYRRAVLRGFEPMTGRRMVNGDTSWLHPGFWEGPAREAAMSLLKDRDPHVRESLLNDQWELMTKDE